MQEKPRSSSDICTLTLNPAIDRSTSVDCMTPDDKLVCGQEFTEAGGGGLNVSRVIKELGGRSLALHTAGGPTGDMLEIFLKRSGVDQKAFAIEGWTRENFSVFETVTQKEFRFDQRGPAFKTEEWAAVLDYFKSDASKFSWCVASGSLPPAVPPSFYSLLNEIVKSKGARMILDCSSPSLKEALTSEVYLIKPNLRELRSLTDLDLKSEEEQESAAETLIASRKCEVVVLSRGSAGAFLTSKEGSHRLRSPSVAIRSTVGAGDSMVAGIVYKLSQGATLLEATCYGVACGAASVTRRGQEKLDLQLIDTLYRREDLQY